MKTVLWKPFQRWTGSLYSQYRSSRGDTSHDKSKVELTSQDPIVEGNEGGVYRLTSMDFGKRSHSTLEEERYPSRLEKTLGRLPSTNYHGRDSKTTSPTVDEVSSPKLEISKETSIQISSMNKPEGHENESERVMSPTGARPGARTSKNSPYNQASDPNWD